MTPKEEAKLQKEITFELEKQANLRKEHSESIDKWNEGVEKLKRKQKTIADLQKKINDFGVAQNEEDEIRLKVLNKQLKAIEKEAEMLHQVLKDTSSLKVALNDVGKSLGGKVAGGFKNIDKLVSSAYGKLKSSGLFEMDKAIKQSALQMGILSKEGKGYYQSITDAAKITTKIGVGIEELTAMQSAYSEQLGRNVLLTQQGYEAMAQMSVATGLGAEGAVEMAASFENVGLSVEQTGEFINESLKGTHKLGLNASKTMKNLLGGMKMLNKYSFKDGVKGLDRMSKIVTKLGVGMEFAAGMSEKLFNVEGAVEMSAQLQVMGGEWAKLADPFHLMYMARNDMAGLTEELGKAAESSVHFSKETKSFEIGAMEMQRLRVVSEQTGVSLEELAQAGKNAAKFTKIKSQVSFQIGGGKEGKEIKEFLTNKAMFDASGKAKIKIGSDTKLLSQLTNADKGRIKAMMLEEQNMQQRAEDARTFDETLTNTMNGFKISLLPLIKGLDKLIPKIDEMVADFNSPGGWGETIENFAKQVGDFVEWAGKLILNHPWAALITFMSTKFLFDIGRWVANGYAMAKGFNMGVQTPGALPPTVAAPQPGPIGPQPNPNAPTGGGAGGGTTGGTIAPTTARTGGFGATAKSMGKGALGGAAMGAVNMAGAAMRGEKVFTGGNIGNLIGSALGGAAGTFLDPFIGPLGTMLGAQLGGMLGEQVGKMFEDGLFTSPVHDANFSKGRGIVQGGKITPIDNKDDLLAMKKGGVVDNAMNQQGKVMEVDFGEITINGRIEIVSPGIGLSVDLMKDPQFKREIARVVSSEVEKNRNGGKNKV